MKKIIDASKIELLELFIPTLLVLNNNNLDGKEVFKKLTLGSKEILKDFELKNINKIEKNELKKEILRTLSSLLAANIIYSRDLNINNIISEIKEIINSEFTNNLDIINSTKFDSTNFIIFVLPIFKEIKSFHLGLYYADVIKRDEAKLLEDNLIKNIMNSILKIKEELNKEDFLKNIQIISKIYTTVLNLFFENIIKNDKILNEYIKNQEIFIKEIDNNYNNLLKDFEKTIEYIIN